jgi:hypothetical protein
MLPPSGHLSSSPRGYCGQALGAVKLELLLLKTFWIKIFPMFLKKAGKGGSFLDP